MHRRRSDTRGHTAREPMNSLLYIAVRTQRAVYRGVSFAFHLPHTRCLSLPFSRASRLSPRRAPCGAFTWRRKQRRARQERPESRHLGCPHGGEWGQERETDQLRPSDPRPPLPLHRTDPSSARAASRPGTGRRPRRRPRGPSPRPRRSRTRSTPRSDRAWRRCGTAARRRSRGTRAR